MAPEQLESGEIDVDGLYDKSGNIQYIGKARKQTDGTWRCLANVGGALCLVEVRLQIQPVRSNHGPGLQKSE